jgi:Na+-transporting methylmalonyl-CoA/oxaloacetate decarboxylase gamma subunit
MYNGGVLLTMISTFLSGKAEDYMSNIIETARNLDWGYIWSTLIIRYVGVFVVLFILMIGMILLGKIVSAVVASQEEKDAEGDENDPHSIELAEEPEREVGEEEIVAAIGAALALSMEPDSPLLAPPAFGGIAAGSWSLAGRAAQMGGRMQGGTQKRA